MHAVSSSSPPAHRAVLREQVAALAARYEGVDAPRLLEGLLTHDFPNGKLALVSSFGTESAVLLHLVASIDRQAPVYFVDTYKLFPETYAYVAQLTEQLGLENIHHLRTPIAQIKAEDPDSTLWQTNPDRCCHLRKVLPLQEALGDTPAWITGRKRWHGGGRQKLAVFEEDGTHIKVNPLATWGADDIDAYFGEHRLPGHPLLASGFLSVGCVSCTARPLNAADPRSGRWQDSGKTECGIHAPTDYEI
jgi:phosphoadenosine phosphosulfate reductase